MVATRARRVGLVVGSAAAAAALWLVDLGHPPLWTDEALTLQFSQTWGATTADFHPSLSYVAFWLWRMVVPDEVAWLRLFPALLSLATAAVWLAFWTARRREGQLSRLAVALAVGLTVASPHLLLYGRMIRYFSLASVLVTVTVALWWRAMGEGPRWAVAATAVAGAALALTSYVAAASLASALTAFAALRRRHRLRRHAAVGATASAIALVAVLASTLAASPPASGAGGPRIAVAAAFPLWSATVGETVNVFDFWLLAAAVAAWAVVAVTALCRLRGAPDVVVLSALLVVAGMAGTAAGGALTGLEHTAAQSPKLFAPFAPALYLLAGVSLAQLVTAGRAVVAGVAVAGIAVAWVPGVVNLHTGTDFLYTSYALPWDDVVEVVGGRVEAEGGRGRSVAVVTVDPALVFLLGDERLAAPGDADVVMVVDRDRVNPELEAALDRAHEVLRSGGYVAVETHRFGTVEPRLRRLQERLADRDLTDALVTVVVYEVRP